ncbi:hypothetical protein NEUTE2DRAFT_51592 [Neurospora tetrasperma FGSC 2509]|nr:hypothetical protein NEUTE2DRAFT_51592 [Neurospora tetrasperma FGSC 2509]
MTNLTGASNRYPLSRLHGGKVGHTGVTGDLIPYLEATLRPSTSMTGASAQQRPAIQTLPRSSNRKKECGPMLRDLARSLQQITVSCNHDRDAFGDRSWLGVLNFATWTAQVESCRDASMSLVNRDSLVQEREVVAETTGKQGPSLR